MMAIILWIALFATACHSQDTSVLTAEENICSSLSYPTCGQCISVGPQCGWCSQPGYDTDEKSRCDLLRNLRINECESSFIVNPQPEVMYDVNNDVRDEQAGKDAIQLAPQKMRIKTRPNTPVTFNVTYRQAENYPVDLYFVMDLSKSMEDDRNNLVTLSGELATRLSEITPNYRIGFGSFVDKKISPFADEDENYGIYAAPYGFKNQLSLTQDATQFKNKVNQSVISINRDAPEGGFDAIMQAIICKSEIGWRETSRKIMLYVSNDKFHIGGDGKVAGILTPNDGQCHLDAEGYYTETLNQDYPSVGHLAHTIVENKVNVIFAVTEKVQDLYLELSRYIQGSIVGQLARDSQNIVTLVQENYRKISSSVELGTEFNEGVNVHIRSSCFGGEFVDSSTCSGVPIGSPVKFEITITIQQCPAEPAGRSTELVVYPVGLSERLEIDMELECQCSCEDPAKEVSNSDMCSRNGTYECGACTCNEGHFGQECECDASTSADNDAACKRSDAAEICSGRGQCICNRCQCNAIITSSPDQKFTGQYCECDDYSCEYHNGKICGGPSQGMCKCGVCQCNSEFTGDACQCTVNQASCRAKTQDGKLGLICNGQGTCECGTCNCFNNTFYRGPTCEDCPNCQGACDEKRACVQCKAFQSGPFSERECFESCEYVQIVSEIQESSQSKLCEFKDEDGCLAYFAYEYNSDQVQVKETKNCPVPVRAEIIALPIVAATFLLGFLIIAIWKAYTYVHDKREFAKFEMERQNAKWQSNDNAIYKQAKSTYQNPMYAAEKQEDTPTKSDQATEL